MLFTKDRQLELRTLCSAWTLAKHATQIASELLEVASDGIKTSAVMIEECKSRPLCEYSRERHLFDQALAEARKQKAKAVEMVHEFQARQDSIRSDIEILHGVAAFHNCPVVH
jgi:hypothetical protein